VRSPYLSVLKTLSLALGVVVTIGHDPRAAEPIPVAAETPPSEPEIPTDPAETPPETPAETLPGTTPATTTHQGIKTMGNDTPSPWRGSEVAYRNSASTISFDQSAELTYNPTWVMSLELSPRYNFSDMVSLSASIELAREVTNADDTTERGETVLGDLALRLGVARWATLPGGITLSSALGVTLPTSLASQADTMLFTVTPSLRVSKTFRKVLDGLTIGYGLRFSKLFHSYTTGEQDAPLIPGCNTRQLGSCDRFLNSGYRNVSFRITNGFDVSLGLTSWLSFSAEFDIVTSWLYDAYAPPPEDEFNQPIANTDTRYALVTDLGFSARPWTPLEIRLGAATVNPQLKPDGDRYAPFFNRYTFAYLDIRLDVAELVTELGKEE